MDPGTINVQRHQRLETLARERTQRVEALARANRVRHLRAALKRRIADGGLSAAEVILVHQREMEGMSVADVLTSQRQWGDRRCRKFLVPMGLQESKTIGSMTERQRLAVAARLSGRPAEPSASKGTDKSQHGVVSSQGLDDHTQVVKLAGEFDLGTTPKFDQAIDDALDSGRRNLVVDLRSVSFLDATLLNALVRSEALLRGCGRRFALVRPRPRVWRLFVLTGLNRALPIFAGMSEAVESFQDLGVVTTASGW